MASPISRDGSPEGLDPLIVGDVFVNLYYLVLENSPEMLHRFYKNESVLVRPGPHGATVSVTTVQGITDMILSSDYKGCTVKITSTDIQASAPGRILVAVTGDLIGKDSLRKTFWQTFFVAKKERGFLILNDILRFVEPHESLPHSSSNGADTNASNVPLSPDQETPVLLGSIQSSARTEVTDNGKKESNVEDAIVEVSDSSVVPCQNEEWFIVDSSTLIHSDSNADQDTQKTPYASMVYYLRQLATKLNFSEH